MINGIQLQFSNGINTYQTAYNGIVGNISSTFIVPTGQLITSIYMCYGPSKIFTLQFSTYQGTFSQVFGSVFGAGACPGSSTIINLPEGLIGIGGYTSNLVNGLYFFSNQSTSLTTNSGITTGLLSCF